MINTINNKCETFCKWLSAGIEGILSYILYAGKENLNGLPLSVIYYLCTCASLKIGTPALLSLSSPRFWCTTDLALHVVLRRKGRHINRRQYSIKPVWESGSWCTVESVASIHHLAPLCLQKQSVLYAEMLNSKPVTHWENSVTARIYLPITCVCPHGSKG